MTVGENIADNGGLREAYKAYQIYSEKNGRRRLPGELGQYTNDQLFFLAAGRIWCTKERPGNTAARRNPHSPPEFRVDGSMMNFDEFAKAFKCASGTRMNPVKKCVVWG